MTNTASPELVARLVDPRAGETLDLMGPTIRFLTQPEDGAPCVMRGTIPPGGVVPLHAHADPETFLSLSGELEGLVHSGDDFRWVRIGAGDVFHVPGGARHAFRNRGSEPAVQVVVSTARLGRFFREVDGASAERFLATAERYGYWMGTPEENAEAFS